MLDLNIGGVQVHAENDFCVLWEHGLREDFGKEGVIIRLERALKCRCQQSLWQTIEWKSCKLSIFLIGSWLRGNLCAGRKITPAQLHEIKHLAETRRYILRNQSYDQMTAFAQLYYIHFKLGARYHFSILLGHSDQLGHILHTANRLADLPGHRSEWLPTIWKLLTVLVEVGILFLATTAAIAPSCR